MKILGIETSCDETAASLLEIPNSKSQDTKKIQITNLKIQTLSNIVLSQVEIHKKYGGVVPEVAARQHVESINWVVQEVLVKNSPPSPRLRRASKSPITNHQSQITKPDLIAVTYGPGLITALQVGVQTAKTLAYTWNVPLIGVNHLEGHLWSYLLNSNSQDTTHKKIPSSKFQVPKKIQDTRYKFPAIGLIVSGGHTELVLVKGIGKYQLIGRTRDDAVGEAFDKVAKMMELGYPGGPIISHFAKLGNSSKVALPRPMIKSGDFDFSFSGLKTAVKNHLDSMLYTGPFSQSFINDVCASFQAAVIDVLVTKTMAAAKLYKAKSIILGGGVAANEELIKNLEVRSKKLGLDFCFPERQLTGDNAAMIALAGYFGSKKASKNEWKKLVANANLRLVE